LNTPFLSIILPAYNEETRLPASLEKIFAFLEKQSYQTEVVIVENGSQDRTLEIANQFAEQHPNLRVISTMERGKGLAVRRGMLEAEGEYRFICDVDLSMPIEEVNLFIPPILPEIEIAIASREAPGAVRIDEPEYRHIIGRIFNTMVKIIALPGLQDTQCGFKCFRKDVAEAIFKKQTLMGWSFDVELLYIAREMGYKIIEVPIHWYFDPGSRVKLFRDSFQMALDLFTIRKNGRLGLYK
jgi:glycosyltransferase involved in cell wall biosynthesis